MILFIIRIFFLQINSSNETLSNCSINSSPVIFSEHSGSLGDNESSSSISKISSSSKLSVMSASDKSNDDNDEEFRLLLSEDFLFDGSDAQRDEAVLNLLKLYVKHKWTKMSLQDLLSYIASILPEPNNMPKTNYKIFQYLENVSTEFTITKHYYCSGCLQGKTVSNELCKKCKITKSGVFYTFSVRELIKFCFKKRGLADVLDKHLASFDPSDGTIRDIRDGEEYKKIKETLNGRYDLIMMWGTDGVATTKSSNMKFYPTQMTFCDIPHILRASFTMVTSVYIDEKSPKMKVLLKPFTDELKSIFDEGGVTWTHPETNEQHTSQVVAPLIIADAPVRADILNMEHHRGLNPCNICEQTAKSCTVLSKKKEVKRSFLTYCKRPANIRTKESMLEQGRKAEKLNANQNSKSSRRGKTKKVVKLKTKKGIKGLSVVADIPMLDISKCVTPEYMHSALLGSARHFATVWTSVKGNWYIKKDCLSTKINEVLRGIKTPDFITRSPKDITKKLKASEDLLWLLYYSLPTISSLLEEDYIQHWILFVFSMFTLLQNSISKEELKKVEKALILFVKQIGKLYRPNDYTYNNHQLIHLALIVLRWGPLWAHSAFIFEDNNGLLTKSIHSNTNQGAEIVNNLKVIYSIRALEDIVSKSLSKTSVEMKSIIDLPLDTEVNDFLKDKDLTNIQYFGKVCFTNKTFTGSLLDEILQTCNSYVEFRNENNECEYGRIKLFMETDAGERFCLITVCQIDDSKYFCHEKLDLKIDHVIPIVETKQMLVIKVDQVVTTLIKVRNYLCKKPNTVEYKY